MGSRSNDDEHNLKFLFWVLAPFLFIAIMRMFHVLFSATYGGLLLLIYGQELIEWISQVAFVLGGLSAFVFTIASFTWLYRQFKKYIVEG